MAPNPKIILRKEEKGCWQWRVSLLSSKDLVNYVGLGGYDDPMARLKNSTEVPSEPLAWG